MHSSQSPRRFLRSLVAAVALLLGLLGAAPQVDGRQDITAQFYKLYQQRSVPPPLSFLPDPIPETVLKRIRGKKFTEFSTALQRALLWDVGLVATGDADRKAFVQVLVPCGSTMNDIFLPRDTISEKAGCGSVNCNAQILTYALSNCSGSKIQPLTKCAITESEPVTASSSNPLWMQDGQIDAEPLFQVFVHSTGPSALYTIQEKPKLQLTDDRSSCPNKASFIIPCRRISASDGDAWCAPESGALVDLWIREEMSGRSADGTKHSGESSSSSTSATANLYLVLLIASIAVSVFLAVALYLTRRRLHSSSSMTPRGSSFLGYEVGAAYDRHDSSRRLQAPRTTGLPSERSSAATVDKAQAMRSPAGATDVVGTNAQWCARSRELAEFVADQELALKFIEFSELRLISLIAKGANGEVWRGEYAGECVAIKRLLPEKRQDLGSLECFTREIRLASALEHPNIVKLIGVSWRALPDLCIVSELMVIGDLAHFLVSKESRNLTWKKEKLALALDIANALVYLHSLMPVIIHRDLKSLNVLVNEKLEAKLSDFGLSRERTFDETMTGGVGTLLWTAPEVLRGDRYSEKADIYSYGVVLSELDTCLPPYSLNEEVARAKHKNAQLLPMIRNGKIKPRFRHNAPQALLDLALSCLDVSPDNRPPAMQIVYLLRSKVLPTLE
ncbi:hypothetical protein ATCC90586_000432 [Pythium insidiosum]|nr:hypothetical protein ATCC90586_000432 [Pythium insidiosum]